MSDTGKIARGKAWTLQRDIHGVLPDGVKNDPEKMKDVKFYLATLTPVKPKVKK